MSSGRARGGQSAGSSRGARQEGPAPRPAGSNAHKQQQITERKRSKKKDRRLLSLRMLMRNSMRYEAGEDVLHDVFVSFARRIGQLTLNGSLKGYLLTSCANRARDLLRRRGVRQDPAGVLEIAVSGDPAKAAEVAEETVRAVAALTKLPSEQREVVALRIHGQFTFREVVRLLGIPVNTAKSRYRYALTALRKELNHDNRQRPGRLPQAGSAQHNR